MTSALHEERRVRDESVVPSSCLRLVDKTGLSHHATRFRFIRIFKIPRKTQALLFVCTISAAAGPHAAMIIPPVEVMLRWPTPNYENPEIRGLAIIVVNSVFLALSIIVVLLRLYTRIFITRWFGLDDVLILVTILFTIALNGTFYAGALHYGWNRHIWDIPLSWNQGRLLLSSHGDCHVQYRVAN